MDHPAYLFLVAGGLFSVCGAVFDWDFFFNNYRARPIVAMLGRTGARVFYALLGAAIMILGILLATGTIQNAR
jgi:hypothetical protein